MATIEERDQTSSAAQEPPTKRPRLVSSSFMSDSKLPSVNTLVDHDLLNYLLNSQRGDWRATLLFNAVGSVRRDPGWRSVLDPELASVGECEGLIEGNQDLSDLLDDCARKGDWEPLFARLMAPKTQHATYDKSRDSRVEEKGRKATITAWTTAFVGSDHQRLHRTLNRLSEGLTANPEQEEPKWLYSNILPIVQSSGMGKSRTVDELAKLVFTIPICLRDAGESGYPAGDHQLFKAFTNVTNFQDIDTPKILCMRIFTAIFKAIEEEVQRSAVASELDWYKRLKETRGCKTVRTGIYDEAMDILRQLREIPVPDQPSLKLNAVSGAMKESLISLIKNLPQLKLQEKKPAIVLYVDECHRLTTIAINDSNNSRKRTMLDCLLYAMDQCGAQGLFGVTLSTNSVLSQVSFPQHVLPSQREIEVGVNVRPPPFVQFTFDTWKNGNAIIQESHLSLFDVCKVEFLARFGRPFWWTRITDPVTGEIDTEEAGWLTHTAATKLLSRDGGVTKLSEAAQFASLSVRACLDLEPSRTSSRTLEEVLVASHMRIAYNVPYHKEYMRSGYSSEPILAEAAAQIWNNTLGGYRGFNPLESLTHFAEKNMLSKGERGELVARFILLRAQDIAVLNVEKTGSAIDGRLLAGTARFSRPVPLWEFFQALLSPEALASIENQGPRNRARRTSLKNACKDKFVRFSHFARAGDSSVLSTAAGWKALARANAWQCYAQQKMIDMLVPVYSKLNEKFILDRRAITFILLQIKNTIEAKTVHLSAEALGIFDDAPASAKKLPYFVIVFNFGVSTDESPQPGPPSASIATASPAKVKMRTKGERSTTDDDPQSDGRPCYWIEVTGCSAKALNPSIIANGSKELRSVLATHTVAAEASDSETRDAIQRMKPESVAGEASFDWSTDEPKWPKPGTVSRKGALDGIEIVSDDETFK